MDHKPQPSYWIVNTRQYAAGMAEANEAPDLAAVRELREELGPAVTVRGLLVVDWVAPHGPWDDQIAFVFDGGVLDAAVAAGLRPCDGELSEPAFVAPGRARGLLNSRMARRFAAAVASLGDGVSRHLRTDVRE
ncbi:NUDIX domain-containing protein [Streptomyces sp. NPDC021100]|uniref:NUDIX domain-containing protein n=1 Tax=Streptomyces sp. NPDC021100 TaxID=3365114 RepID=UPI0037900D2B